MTRPLSKAAPPDALSSTAASHTAMGNLIHRVRTVVRGKGPAREVATGVADALRVSLPGPDLLSAAQRLGHPDRYEQHVLHVEDDGSFSIVALVWRPGQATPIHDHVAWCVVAVMQGTEQETIYEVRERPAGSYLVASDCRRNTPATVCGFAPPGDIHAVRNAGEANAISLHVYGADISALGSSVRRTYELPVERE